MLSADRNDASVCIVCPRLEQDAANATYCKACAPGNFSDAAGTKLCTRCAAGYFSNVGRSVCMNCEPGWMQPLLGQLGCVACPRGKMSSVGASTACIECAAGWFQNASGQSACTPCASGHFSNVSSATSCMACGVGLYQVQLCCEQTALLYVGDARSAGVLGDYTPVLSCFRDPLYPPVCVRDLWEPSWHARDVSFALSLHLPHSLALDPSLFRALAPLLACVLSSALHSAHSCTLFLSPLIVSIALTGYLEHGPGPTGVDH